MAANEISGDVASSPLRALVSAACLAAVLLVAAIGVVPTAVASRRPGTRVTVAMFGDSVTESIDVPNFLKTGMVPQLARAVSALGFAPGGVGLIPAAIFRWHFNKWAEFGTGPIPTNGWLAIGYTPNSGDDGPSGYSALATSPLARATVTVGDPDVEILYTSTNIPCTFTVSSAAKTWTIDTFRPGPMADTGTSITLPSGRHQLTVHGPSCGVLLFDGAVARRPALPGQVQVEVDNLGHTAELPSLHFGPRVRQSLTDQRYDISVFLFGYVGEALFGPGISKPYLNAMTARARIAREHGGACLIVAPTPIAVPQSWVTKISGLDRTVARREKCTYTTVLAHLWTSPTTAERQGLLYGDGIHPTGAGDKAITRVLAPIVAQLVRAHLHG